MRKLKKRCNSWECPYLCSSPVMASKKMISLSEKARHLCQCNLYLSEIAVENVIEANLRLKKRRSLSAWETSVPSNHVSIQRKCISWNSDGKSSEKWTCNVISINNIAIWRNEEGVCEEEGEMYQVMKKAVISIMAISCEMKPKNESNVSNEKMKKWLISEIIMSMSLI